MLSLGRLAINSVATCFAASMRLGFKSSASILVEMSTAIMISIPSRSHSVIDSCVCGRANTFFSEELYELLRLVNQDAEESVERLEEIDISIDFSGASKDSMA